MNISSQVEVAQLRRVNLLLQILAPFMVFFFPASTFLIFGNVGPFFIVSVIDNRVLLLKGLFVSCSKLLYVRNTEWRHIVRCIYTLVM